MPIGGAAEVTVWSTTLAEPSREVAGRVLRDVLGAVLAVDPADLRIDRRCARCGDAAHGKPAVAGAPDLSFSLSHSGATVVVATAFDACVGVDVEELRPRARLDRLAARVLTAPEHAAWCRLRGDERLEAFLRHWTAREAYLKAIGVGLRRSVRDAVAEAAGWTVVPLDGLSGAVGAVAVDRPATIRPAPWPVPSRA